MWFQIRELIKMWYLDNEWVKMWYLDSVRVKIVCLERERVGMYFIRKCVGWHIVSEDVPRYELIQGKLLGYGVGVYYLK